MHDDLASDELHLAAGAGDLERVRVMLEAGADVDAFDDLGLTALHHAARGGHAETVRALVEAGADPNASCEEMAGDTPLGYVAGSCSLEIARLLVEAGADPTIPGGMQITALAKARARKRSEGLRVRDVLETAAKRSARTRR